MPKYVDTLIKSIRENTEYENSFLSLLYILRNEGDFVIPETNNPIINETINEVLKLKKKISQM